MMTEEAYDDNDLKWPNYFQIRNCREEQFNHLWETSGVKPMDDLAVGSEEEEAKARKDGGRQSQPASGGPFGRRGTRGSLKEKNPLF
ncbi:hypothetical protein MTR67_032841 [Solanum verrucosum]|uniref:Uncharacterized protein n=1 Tax=Solanum verrucosum TaxID=315347 RepID=A0AAF0U5C3_SOLVR|nr:hypothetical protein MTR67_032841 [Solanum verrucosum]